MFSNKHSLTLSLSLSNLNILEEEINQSKLTLDLFLDACKPFSIRDSFHIQWPLWCAPGLGSFQELQCNKESIWIFPDFCSILISFPCDSWNLATFLYIMCPNFFPLWYDDGLVIYCSVCKEHLFAGMCSGIWKEVSLISRDYKTFNTSYLWIKLQRKWYIFGEI